MMENTGNVGALLFDETLPHTRSFYQASSVSNSALIAELDQWLSTHEAEVKRLQAKWKI
jgi:hypothetical protein